MNHNTCFQDLKKVDIPFLAQCKVLLHENFYRASINNNDDNLTLYTEGAKRCSPCLEFQKGKATGNEIIWKLFCLVWT